LLLPLDGFFATTFVVSRMRQFLDALLDAVGIGVQFFVRGVGDFAVEGFAALVPVRRVIYDFNLDLVFALVNGDFRRLFFVGKLVFVTHGASYALLMPRGSSTTASTWSSLINRNSLPKIFTRVPE
jgi:hypothetical protein